MICNHCKVIKFIMTFYADFCCKISLCNLFKSAGNAFHIFLDSGTDDNTNQHCNNARNQYDCNRHIADIICLSINDLHWYKCTYSSICTLHPAVKEQVALSIYADLFGSLLVFNIIKEILSIEYCLTIRSGTLLTFRKFFGNDFSSWLSNKTNDTTFSHIKAI